ncbi:MAG: peptidoglycan binding protein CsiV [Gammaproteobacteria bacterium]|nr:peptidoglycan binding protein CsiV [Gammaproteobacteria bacterium]
MIFRTLLLAALLLGLMLPGWSQEEDLTQFDVELIVFRHLTPDESELQVDRVVEDETEEARIPRRRFTPLTPDQLRLGAVSQKLLGSKDWSPILHYGWRQPGIDRDDAPEVNLAGSRRGARATGTVRLSVERFLRLELDLEMDPGSGIRYTLDQSRRMRSGEIHYFDHPQFGVIALVSRAEFPELPEQTSQNP